jgi:N-methylhydantoinase B
VGEPFELLAAFERIDHPPRGRYGGKAGAAGAVAIKDGNKLRGKGTQWVQPGERLLIMTPGGGGLGDPEAREPALIAKDVREERTTAPKG